MSILEAIVLGIIQGLTEFLPISSTGHLTLAGKFMTPNLISETPEQWTSFIAIIQLGTLISILIYFRKDIWNITTAFTKQNLSLTPFKKQTSDSRLGWLIIIGSVPVVIIGLLFKDVIEGAFTKDLNVIAGSLIGLAIILAVAEKTAKFKKDITDVNIIDTLVIGFAQALALIPGSSRSGTTITGGLFMGLKRETAARFSFLLSIPAILGSGLLQIYEAVEFVDASMTVNIIAATIFSGISGYIAIDFLLKFLRRYSTFLFIYYRVALGIIILISLNYI